MGQLADGTLHLGVENDWEEARARLLALPGFGPWTADVIAMRALGDPDAFLPTDLGIRYAAQESGLPSTPAALTARAAAWRPWRAYAVQYLWATGSHPINYLPAPAGTPHTSDATNPAPRAPRTRRTSRIKDAQ